MDREDAIALCWQTKENWNKWHDIDRGEAVSALHEHGYSLRQLALILDCSEGLIRHLEIVGDMSPQWKRRLENGESTRSVVAEWRARYC